MDGRGRGLGGGGGCDNDVARSVAGEGRRRREVQSMFTALDWSLESLHRFGLSVDIGD